jgi:hypothetical protein
VVGNFDDWIYSLLCGVFVSLTGGISQHLSKDTSSIGCCIGGVDGPSKYLEVGRTSAMRPTYSRKRGFRLQGDILNLSINDPCENSKLETQSHLRSYIQYDSTLDSMIILARPHRKK